MGDASLHATTLLPCVVTIMRERRTYRLGHQTYRRATMHAIAA